MPPKSRKSPAQSAATVRAVRNADGGRAKRTELVGRPAPPIANVAAAADTSAPPEMRTVRSPVQARSKKRMAVVLRAAAELLEETGVEGFTIRGLEQQAGVSSGWIYRFFPDRDAIIEAVMLEFSAASRDVIPALEAAESWQQVLEDEVNAMVHLFRSSPGMGVVWLSRRRTGLVEQADTEANDLIARQLAEKLLPWATVTEDELRERVRVSVDGVQGMIEQAFRSGRGDDSWLIGEITRMRIAYLAPCFAPSGSAGLAAPPA
jgi:AcrR family transcriptional regulator